MDYFGLFLPLYHHLLLPFLVLLLEVELIDTIEGIIYLSSTVLALLLLALSISAYRNTGIKKIKYAIGAFALFAAYLFYEYMEGVFKFLEAVYSDIILASVTFGVLILFFLAIIKKN
jgi:ABC-type multidrug transport system permease subunit